MSRVFVTGADGLLGSNVVRELLHRGYEVVAMVLKNREPVTLLNLPVEIVYGDITLHDQVVDLSRGCNYFIHIAAITDLWPSKGLKYFKVNLEGTKNAVDAALINKVKRFIHVGSASSFGFGTIDVPGDETSEYHSDNYGLDYLDSKKAGQDYVLEAVKSRNLPAIVVCPTFMIGPYDSKPSSGAMVLAIAKRKLPAIAGGGKNWVHVKDVAIALCNALTQGEVGEAYILGGENLTFKEAVKRIAIALGQSKYPQSPLPEGMVKAYGSINESFAKLFGSTPSLSLPMAKVACDGHYFSAQKAIAALNMPQTPIEEAVKELQDWFIANGYL